MHTHPNARLKQKGRLRLVSGHLNDHRPLAELAAEAGISLRCAYKWLARYRTGGAASLADRRSVSRNQRRTLGPLQLQREVQLRHQRLDLRHIDRLLIGSLSWGTTALQLRFSLNQISMTPFSCWKVNWRLNFVRFIIDGQPEGRGLIRLLTSALTASL